MNSSSSTILSFCLDLPFLHDCNISYHTVILINCKAIAQETSSNRNFATNNKGQEVVRNSLQEIGTFEGRDFNI